MHVLPAEAQVLYDVVLEMDEIHGGVADTSVVLVVGAHDTVDPAALGDLSGPVIGMPVLKVREAEQVIVAAPLRACRRLGVHVS